MGDKNVPPSNITNTKHIYTFLIGNVGFEMSINKDQQFKGRVGSKQLAHSRLTFYISMWSLSSISFKNNLNIQSYLIIHSVIKNVLKLKNPNSWDSYLYSFYPGIFLKLVREVMLRRLSSWLSDAGPGCSDSSSWISSCRSNICANFRGRSIFGENTAEWDENNLACLLFSFLSGFSI